MDLHRMSPARVQLQAAITEFANAERAVMAAGAAVEVQTAELQKSIAALEQYSEIESRAAQVTVARVKAKINGRWPGAKSKYEDREREGRNLRSDRNAKRRAEEQVADDRAALQLLMTEHDEAISAKAMAALKRAEAIELVMAEEGAALLARARDAETYAASLRAELMAMDGLWLSAGPGIPPRLLLKNSAIPAHRDIVAYLRSPLSEAAPSHEQRAAWKALVAALEADADATRADDAVKAAAAAMPRPALPAGPPQIPWEQTAAYRGEAAQAAEVGPSAAHGVGLAPNAPAKPAAPEPRFEDSELAKRPWAKPQGEPMTQRYEDTPAYAAERAQFSGRA